MAPSANDRAQARRGPLSPRSRACQGIERTFEIANAVGMGGLEGRASSELSLLPGRNVLLSTGDFLLERLCLDVIHESRVLRLCACASRDYATGRVAAGTD